MVELSEELSEEQERLRLGHNLASDIFASNKQNLSVKLAGQLEELVKILDTDSYTLEEVKALLKPEDKSKQEFIIISCDASITENPGGQVAVGFVIRFPEEDKIPPMKQSKRTPSTTNNEGEYDAIYEAIVHLLNMVNVPRHEIIIYSDSKLVVNQLKGEYNIKNERLKNKCEAIHELAAVCPSPIRIEWKPRNSTEDLTEANWLAQDEIGVRRH